MRGYEDIEMLFGKHKGELLADVPDSYLYYLLDQEFVEEKYSKLHQMCKLEQQYRINHNVHVR